DVQRVPEQAPAQQAPQHGRSQAVSDHLGPQIDERDQTTGDMDAVCADQREKGGQESAPRGPGSIVHHAGKFRNLYEKEGRTEHECEYCEDQEASRLSPFGGQRSESACIAREEQTHRLDEDVAQIEQLGSGRSARGVVPQDRISREQRREHYHVAEDEDPEPVSDDDALGSRPAAASPACELGWNRGWNSIDYCGRYAGSFVSPGPFHL